MFWKFDRCIIRTNTLTRTVVFEDASQTVMFNWIVFEAFFLAHTTHGSASQPRA